MAVAFIVGSVELLSIATGKLGLRTGFRGWLSGVNLNLAGYVIVALFALTCLRSRSGGS